MLRAEARIAQLRSTATEPRTVAAIGYPPDYTDSSSKNEKLAQTAFQEQGIIGEVVPRDHPHGECGERGVSLS